MSRISKEKREKIMSNILGILFENYPKALLTVEISRAEARDEEFIKSILQELEAKKLVLAVKKSPKGEDYIRWIRWRLGNKAYSAYKNLTPDIEPEIGR